MKLISIIVPVYNVERYLERCIESLINQTYKNIEIILVDDGSPDNCGAICDKYARCDNRVKVLHQRNQGLSCARNSGLKIAAGEYICFIDSDDYVSEKYCEVLHNLLESTNYDYSVCGAHRFADGSEPCPKNVSIHGTFSNIEFLELQLTKKSEFGVWNKMYRKRSLLDLTFAEGKVHEDVIWSADLAKKCHNGVICTREDLYYYRQRENGIVNQGARRCNPDRLYAGEYLANTIRLLAMESYSKALEYAIEYPWMFVDPIYIHREFRENKVFLNDLQTYLKKYLHLYEDRKIFSSIWLKRMKLFSKSKFLYSANVYVRLFRVYLYRILGLDAYKDGHGV